MSTDKPILSRRQRASAKLNQRHMTFARLTAIEGLSQAEAYRQAFGKPNLEQPLAAKYGNDVAGLVGVKVMVRDLLRAAKIQDLLTSGAWLAKALETRDAAVAAGNYTAGASYDRMLGQAVGALKDSVTISTASSTPDADLIKRLAGDDPAKQAQVAALIGKPDFAKSLN